MLNNEPLFYDAESNSDLYAYLIPPHYVAINWCENFREVTVQWRSIKNFTVSQNVSYDLNVIIWNINEYYAIPEKPCYRSEVTRLSQLLPEFPKELLTQAGLDTL